MTGANELARTSHAHGMLPIIRKTLVCNGGMTAPCDRMNVLLPKNAIPAGKSGVPVRKNGLPADKNAAPARKNAILASEKKEIETKLFSQSDAN